MGVMCQPSRKICFILFDRWHGSYRPDWQMTWEWCSGWHLVGNLSWGVAAPPRTVSGTENLQPYRCFSKCGTPKITCWSSETNYLGMIWGPPFWEIFICCHDRIWSSQVLTQKGLFVLPYQFWTATTVHSNHWPSPITIHRFNLSIILSLYN